GNRFPVLPYQFDLDPVDRLRLLFKRAGLDGGANVVIAEFGTHSASSSLVRFATAVSHASNRSRRAAAGSPYAFRILNIGFASGLPPNPPAIRHINST